ncbi:MAG: chromate transporter [Rhodoferax sp.]|nr:chromate transporter [Rhodoferax sp.]
MIQVDWLALLTHFLSLSLLAVSGAISTAPDMHRFLVAERQWLTDGQFSSSIALAQAAPGPNVLFVALLGWNVGMNAGGGLGAGLAAWDTGLLGMLIAMGGMIGPSTVLTYTVARWARRNRHLRAVRAFKQGMAPMVVGLLLSTGWLLTLGHGARLDNAPLWLLSLASALLAWQTRLHLLGLLGAGAALGAMGWV